MQYNFLYDNLDDTRRSQITEACKSVKIFSTLPYKKIPFWNECVQTCQTSSNSPRRIWELLVSARKYDVVLLTGGEKVDLLYAAIAYFAFWINTPHIIVDAHWQKSTGPVSYLQKIILRLSGRLVKQYQPHSEEEIRIYNELFGIPIEKLNAIPWSTSLIGHNVSPANSDEISNCALTGGSSFRDYDFLFKALCGTDLCVNIGIKRGKLAEKLTREYSNCSNLNFLTNLSNQEYLRLMAGCKFFLMPIVAGLNRATADQTILNAMFFGRIVIATNSIGPRIYIKHGVNGFLVEPSSTEAWKNMIEEVSLLSDARIREISENASRDARVLFNEPLRLYKILISAISVATHMKY